MPMHPGPGRQPRETTLRLTAKRTHNLHEEDVFVPSSINFIFLNEIVRET